MQFLRNDVIDTKNLFATAKPPYKRNDYGASAGAPITRNKLFIFGDFEIFSIGRVRPRSILFPLLPSGRAYFRLPSMTRLHIVLQPVEGRPSQTIKYPPHA